MRRLIQNCLYAFKYENKWYIGEADYPDFIYTLYLFSVDPNGYHAYIGGVKPDDCQAIKYLGKVD
jgi:hypothetical protein